MKHCLSVFRFCPKCGAEAFTVHDDRSKRCAACGFTYYQNAAASAAAVILDNEGRLLCVRRAAEPHKGTLALPGGFAEFGESLETACLREVREETGLEVHIERFLFSEPNVYEYSGFTVNTLDSFFLCSATPEALRHLTAADDAEELLWVPLATLDPKAIGLPSVRRAVERIKRGEL